MEKFKIDDKVMFAEDPLNQYKIVATKTYPKKRSNLEDATVPVGYDYLVVQIDRGGEFGTFRRALESQLSLITK